MPLRASLTKDQENVVAVAVSHRAAADALAEAERILSDMKVEIFEPTTRIAVLKDEIGGTQGELDKRQQQQQQQESKAQQDSREGAKGVVKNISMKTKSFRQQCLHLHLHLHLYKPHH